MVFKASIGMSNLSFLFSCPSVLVLVEESDTSPCKSSRSVSPSRLGFGHGSGSRSRGGVWRAKRLGSSGLTAHDHRDRASEFRSITAPSVALAIRLGVPVIDSSTKAQLATEQPRASER